MWHAVDAYLTETSAVESQGDLHAAWKEALDDPEIREQVARRVRRDKRPSGHVSCEPTSRGAQSPAMGRPASSRPHTCSRTQLREGTVRRTHFSCGRICTASSMTA